MISKNEKTFCIMPFVHMYAEPSGEMKPCCIAGGFEKPLDLKTMSIKDAYNSPQMKELRKTMLTEGEKHGACMVCYEREDRGEFSPRNQFNSNTTWELPKVEDDYSVEPDFQHVDIRFSNLCNFKCRMCNHEFSSNWHSDEPKVNSNSNAKNRTKVIKVSETIVEDIKPYIKNVRSWYFAGGEPLIMPEHKEILNYLHDNAKEITLYGVEKKNISLHYNTNLSVLKFENNNFLELWHDFYKVFLSISCDGIGKIGEYQRTGFNTENFIKNLNLIKLYFGPGDTTNSPPGYNYNFQYTTTMYNIFHMEDFYNFMMNEGHITDERHIDWYYAWNPSRSSIKSLPKSDKLRALTYLENLHSKFTHKDTHNKLESMMAFLQEEHGDAFELYERYDQVIKPNMKMDELCGTNFKDVTGINMIEEFDTKRKKIGGDEWKAAMRQMGL